MKENIHPQYVPARAGCACGSVFITKSTQGDLSVDVCGACHPFYTGTQKLIDTAGRVDRFRKRYAGPKAPPAKAEPPKRTKAYTEARSEIVPRSCYTGERCPHLRFPPLGPTLADRPFSRA
jgi:large subunit ribosomal protein L31